MNSKNLKSDVKWGQIKGFGLQMQGELTLNRKNNKLNLNSMMKIKCFTIRNFRPTEVASYKNKIKTIEPCSDY